MGFWFAIIPFIRFVAPYVIRAVTYYGPSIYRAVRLAAIEELLTGVISDESPDDKSNKSPADESYEGYPPYIHGKGKGVRYTKATFTVEDSLKSDESPDDKGYGRYPPDDIRIGKGTRYTKATFTVEDSLENPLEKKICDSQNRCRWYTQKSVLKTEDLSVQLSWTAIVMSILFIIAACLLFLGVIKKKRMFMLPLIIVGIIYGISDIYHLIDNYSGRRTFEAIMDIVVTITAIFVFKDMSGKKGRTQPRS